MSDEPKPQPVADAEKPLPPVLSVKPSEDGRKLDHAHDRLLRMAR